MPAVSPLLNGGRVRRLMMPGGRLRRVLLFLLVVLCAGHATQAATLNRGINITNWFRYPANRDPAVLAAYISDQALTDLRATGFDFVRLAIGPELLADPGPILSAIRRIQRQGLSVVVSPHPQNWRLETDPAPLHRFWRIMAPLLQALPAERTVPEVVNEPVFPQDPQAWAALQHQVLSDIRTVLPRNTVLLSGHDWGSINGLVALAPEADPNVIYSFHFYDPSELTSLAAWNPAVDHTAFARLPFPVASRSDCEDAAPSATNAATHDLMAYYCALHWDAARLFAQVGQAASWARQHNVRLLAGEFGATAQLPAMARLAWIAAARQAFEANGVAWALWGYDDIMGFALPRPPPARPLLDPGLLSALGLVPHLPSRK